MTRQFDLNTPAAAEYMGVPEQTLKAWRSRGKGPPYRKFPNGKVAYRHQDLDKFSEAHVVVPGEAA